MLDFNVLPDLAESWDVSLQYEKSCCKLQLLSPASFYILLAKCCFLGGEDDGVTVLKVNL